MIWFEKCLTTKMGVEQVFRLKFIFLVGTLFKKNIGERDQKQLKAITVTSSVSMQSVSSVRYN